MDKLAEHLPVSLTDSQPNLPVLIPQPHGGAILSGGVPGHVGAGGRPPNAFKAFLDRLRTDPAALAALERAAKDETGRAFSVAWGVVTDYDTEKPGAKVELSGPNGGPIPLLLLPPET